MGFVGGDGGFTKFTITKWDSTMNKKSDICVYIYIYNNNNNNNNSNNNNNNNNNNNKNNSKTNSKNYSNNTNNDNNNEIIFEIMCRSYQTSITKTTCVSLNHAGSPSGDWLNPNEPMCR